MNVIEYKCVECQSSAKIVDGQIVRSCEHEAGVTADMSATAFGIGNMSDDGFAKRLTQATKNIIEIIKNVRG